MSLDLAEQRYASAKRRRVDTQTELKLEKKIAQELAAWATAKVELDRRSETLEERAQREELQRKLARYCHCPEMSPDWKDNIQLSNPQPHRGGSAS